MEFPRRNAGAPMLHVHQALQPYHAHLGGMFVAGPAGPLHQLTTVHIESAHLRPYRIMVNGGPLPGILGAGFNLWTEQMVQVRLPFVARDPQDEETKAGGGSDLAADTDITIAKNRADAAKAAYDDLRATAQERKDAILAKIAKLNS